MAVSQEFMNAVTSNNKFGIRIMMKNSLLTDPSGSTFEEMEGYAIEHLPNLYDEHDGENLKYDITEWNEDYLNQQMVNVVENFSKERTSLLKTMVKYLFKEKADRITETRNASNSKMNISRKQVGIGMTAVGAAIAVTGLCISQPVVTVGGVIIAATGVVLIVTEKGKK